MYQVKHFNLLHAGMLLWQNKCCISTFQYCSLQYLTMKLSLCYFVSYLGNMCSVFGSRQTVSFELTISILCLWSQCTMHENEWKAACSEEVFLLHQRMHSRICTMSPFFFILQKAIIFNTGPCQTGSFGMNERWEIVKASTETWHTPKLNVQ